MIKSSIMSSLTEIFENVEERTKRIKNPANKLKYINDSLDWVNILVNLLKKLKSEIEADN